MGKSIASRKSKLLSFLIVILPLSEPYSLGGISLDTILFFITIIYGVYNGLNLRGDTFSAKYFFAYALIVPNLIAIGLGYGGHILSSYMVVIPYILCVIRVFPQLELRHMLSRYRTLVYIVCIVFVLQEIMYFIFGFRISGLIPFLPVKYSDVSMSSFIQKQMFFERSSSLFLEPSHMAQYILPYLALVIGQIKNVFNIRNYFEPIVITAIIFLLRSGCGVAGAALIWVAFLFTIKLTPIKRYTFILFGIIVGICVFNKLASTEIGESLINRSSEFEEGASYERSGVIRVVRGFLVYDSESLLPKIFGVGTGGTIDVIERSPYKFMFSDKERYLNNVQILLIGFGLIGAFLFIIHISKLYSKNSVSGRLVLLTFIGISFLESFFFSSKMALYIAFVFAEKFNYLKSPNS